ncbi:MAG: FKBP-type peptidyl-prolyl cis-trans isomerase [Muribaculaceae bacterium]|nr:FKBP-type peptidyl-prolyl cis-trans isomerase [Muribaculaceae bacterium]
MKKLLFIAIAVVAVVGLAACHEDDDKYASNWEKFAEWRATNTAWVASQQTRTNADGTPFYQVVTPSWYNGAFVLVHVFGEPHTENLRPLSTSTVDVIYQGFNCEGERFDSSLTQTAYGPGVARFALNEVIDGWTAAFEALHVGDSAEIVCPYNMAYGEMYMSELIKPYSALRFNVRLVDIYGYEKK